MLRLWLNQNVRRRRNNWQRWRLPRAVVTARRKSGAQKVTSAVRRCRGNWRTVPRRILIGPSCSLWKDSAGGSASRRAIASHQAIMPLKASKILNTPEQVSSDEVLAPQEVHDISSDRHDPTATTWSQPRYGKISVVSRRMTPMVCIGRWPLLCALFVRHFRALVKNGRVSGCRAAAAIIPHDLGKECLLRADGRRVGCATEQLKRKKGKPNVQRSKRLVK